MRPLLAAILFFTGLFPAHAELNAWNFRVLLDGRAIGRHQFTLRGTGEERELRSEARFDVRVLYVSVYRYLHEAVERWNGNCLQSLVSRTETNGDSVSVNAAARGNRLAVERPEPEVLHSVRALDLAHEQLRVGEDGCGRLRGSLLLAFSVS